MTKEQFRKYRTLPRERDYLERRIRILEIRLENVPIVKDKVKSSAKEYPYIETHLTVDAPDPKKSYKIRKEIQRAKRLLSVVELHMDELTEMIAKIEDSRTRQVMTMRYLDGKKLMDVAARVDLTEQHVLRIINTAIKNLEPC